MINYLIVNKTKNVTITDKAKFARTFFSRMIGYMFRLSIDKDDALIFYHAPSIHMFFMRFPLDIIFLDKYNRVIRIFENIQPWSLANCLFSSATIEFPVGTVKRIPIEPGDVIDITHS